MFWRIMLILSLSILTPALAFAQEAQPTAGAQPAGIDEETAQVPDGEKIQRSRAMLEEMRGQLREVLLMVEEARDKSDVIRLDCVNKKLSSVKGLLRIAEQADVALQEALAKKENSIIANEFQKVAIAQRKVGNLRSEAEGCAGAQDVFAGEGTEVEVTEPTIVASGQDPTAIRPGFMAGSDSSRSAVKKQPGAPVGGEPGGGGASDLESSGTESPGDPASSGVAEPASGME